MESFNISPNKRPRYSVAIRTLGLAGDKFIKEINSILAQTEKPDAIYAYIPYGYEIPSFEASDKIIWVRSEKGMITQRAQKYDNIKSELILFLDDDVELQPTSASTMIDALIEHNAQAIVANMFENHEMTPLRKAVNLFLGTGFFSSKRYAFKIRESGYYSYNISPKFNVMESQTGAGPCGMIYKNVFLKTHFEIENWMEQFGYCLGDDQMLYNKIFINGGKILVLYNSGIKNLDAATGGKLNIRKNYKMNYSLKYIIWHRTKYSLHSTIRGRLKSFICFGTIQASNLFYNLIKSIVTFKPFFLLSNIQGLFLGWKYTRKASYRKLPKFFINQ